MSTGVPQTVYLTFRMFSWLTCLDSVRNACKIEWPTDD